MTEDFSLDPGQDRSLLLVDDDEPFVKRLAKAMEKRGFIADTAQSSKLEVTFLDLFGEYRFWVAADYWVIALDPQYRWAVVGHPTRRYGWVLSREPRLAPVVLAEIIGRIKSQGYDACQFVVTPQTGGLSVRRPLCEALP